MCYTGYTGYTVVLYAIIRMPTRQAKRRKYRQDMHAQRAQEHAVECGPQLETSDNCENIRAAWRKASKLWYDTYMAFRKAKVASSRASSKLKYDLNPDAKKARSKVQYQANPEPKKAMSKARSKAQY